MGSKQVFRPPSIQREYGYIGQPPLSVATGRPLQQAWAYMSQYNQRGNLFTYSGAPDESMSIDFDSSVASNRTGTFYVIMYGPQKYDSGDTTRQLHGAFLPWAMDPGFYDYATGYILDTKIEWKDGTGGSFAAIWDQDQKYPEDDPSYGVRSESRTPWLLPHSDYYDNFVWTPPADGEWYLCACKFSHIIPAAFSIWDGPDLSVDDDQIQVNVKDVAPGRLIRGYGTDSDNYPSIGYLNRLIGTQDATEDVLCTMTNRMLLNSGHPIGIYRNVPSYANIAGTGAQYKVCPQNIEEKSSGNATCRPCVVVTTTGCSSEPGYEAYVKFQSATAADTWELEITSNVTAQMFEHSAGTTNSLDVDYDWDYISISLQAPSEAGEIILHSFALVQDTALE